MKLFIGINLPTLTQNDIRAQIHPLIEEYPSFDWVSETNYHITIQFLGETKKIKEISLRLQDLLYDQPSFYLYSKALDLFIRHNITVYLNFQRQKILEQIHKIIRNDFAADHLNSQFIPHLTLAKSKIPSKQQYFVLKKKLSKTIIDTEFKVDKIVIFQSLVKDKHLLYNKIKTIPLIK